MRKVLGTVGYFSLNSGSSQFARLWLDRFLAVHCTSVPHFLQLPLPGFTLLRSSKCSLMTILSIVTCRVCLFNVWNGQESMAVLESLKSWMSWINERDTIVIVLIENLIWFCVLPTVRKQLNNKNRAMLVRLNIFPVCIPWLFFIIQIGSIQRKLKKFYSPLFEPRCSLEFSNEAWAERSTFVKSSESSDWIGFNGLTFFVIFFSIPCRFKWLNRAVVLLVPMSRPQTIFVPSSSTPTFTRHWAFSPPGSFSKYFHASDQHDMINWVVGSLAAVEM